MMYLQQRANETDQRSCNVVSLERNKLRRVKITASVHGMGTTPWVHGGYRRFECIIQKISERE